MSHFGGRNKLYKGLFNSSLHSDKRWFSKVEFSTFDDNISFIAGYYGVMINHGLYLYIVKA